MDTPPKYSLPEIERRWLVDGPRCPSVEGLPYRDIEDRYFLGTGLRLRQMISEDGTTVHKLCKKYGRDTTIGEAITNLYLSPEEHELLSQLGGAVVRKRRYLCAGGSLDVYTYPNDGFTVFEIELDSEAAAAVYSPPAFVAAEITSNPRYSGAALAQRQG